MAVKLIVNIAKKIPIDGLDYSSVQASCSIEGEVAANQDPAIESARLFAQAEAAVDRQLGVAAPSPTSSMPRITMTEPSPSAVSPSSANVRLNTQHAPARRLRGPAPVTDAQLRLLGRLIGEGRASLEGLLSHHGVADLRDLTCKAASEAIDSLKQQAARP